MTPLRREVERLLEAGSQCGVAKTEGTCREILKRREALWTFVQVEGVEPTNNTAERAIRPGVQWRKGSFGTQSKDGSRFVESMMTVVATLKQQSATSWITSPPRMKPLCVANPSRLSCLNRIRHRKPQHDSYFHKLNGYQEAWYLSRLSKGVDVYLEADAQAPALALVEHLERYYPDDSVMDLPVCLGHEHVPCRLLAYRLPEPVVQERRRKALQEARKKGRELSPEYLDWLSFGFYITNVSQQVWPEKVVGTIYRLRWQVELTFRNWKSLLNIYVLKGTRPERIQCIIYGRLITIIMLALISSYASWYAEDYLQRELSLPKLINWLKRKNRLVNAMHEGTLEALLSHLRRALPKLLCKQKRKRRTSRQLIAEYEPYMEDALAA
jgi:hypothetical protein